MSMLDELAKLMNMSNVSLDYRIVNLGGKSIYIEGLKSIVGFGTEEIILQMKKCTLLVLGREMSVKYLDKFTCIIDGEIGSVVVK